MSRPHSIKKHGGYVDCPFQLSQSAAQLARSSIEHSTSNSVMNFSSKQHTSRSVVAEEQDGTREYRGGVGSEKLSSKEKAGQRASMIQQQRSNTYDEDEVLGTEDLAAMAADIYSPDQQEEESRQQHIFSEHEKKLLSKALDRKTHQDFRQQHCRKNDSDGKAAGQESRVTRHEEARKKTDVDDDDMITQKLQPKQRPMSHFERMRAESLLGKKRKR